MALPTKADLQTLDFAYRGQPFCRVEAKALSTKSLDVAYKAQPFVATDGSSGVSSTSATVNSPDIANGIGTITIKGTGASVNSPDLANGSSISGSPTDRSLAFVTVTNASASAKTSEVVSFGLPLAATAITTLRPNIRVYDDNGSGGRGAVLANFQATLKSTDLDSKTRFVRIDGILPALAGSTTRKLEVVATDAAEPTGVAITAADILATSFQCRVTLDIGGVQFIADARTALAGGATFSKTAAVTHGTFYQGTCSTAILCSMPPMNGATPHSSGDGLRVKFQVYAYKSDTAAVSGGNPIIYAHCDVVMENGDVTRVAPSHYYYGLKIERSTSLTDATLIFTDDTDADGNIERYNYSRKLPPDTLTLSATTIGLRTATLTNGNWDSDILGAYIHAASGVGKAYVTARTGNLTATVYIYEAFDASSYAGSAWIQQGIGHNYSQKDKVARVWVGTKPTNIAALGSHTSAITPTTKGVVDYIRGTRMVPNYDTAFSAVTHFVANLDAMKGAGAIRPFTQRSASVIGDIAVTMTNGSNREDIGPNPDWAITGIIKYDKNGRRRLFENARYAATFMYCGFSRYSGAPTNGSVGVIPRPDNGTTHKLNGAFLGTQIALPTTKISEWTTDTDHITQAFYIPYLLTGDMYLLESIESQAWFNNINANSSYSGVGLNGTAFGEANGAIAGQPWGGRIERGVSWTARDIIDAAICVPDADVPMIYNAKSMYKAWMAKHWNVFTVQIPLLTGTTNTHWYNAGLGPRFTSYSLNNATWMTGYSMAVVAHAKGVGMVDAAGQAALAWYMEAVPSASNDPNVGPQWHYPAYKQSGFDQAGVRPKTHGDMYRATMLEHPNRNFQGQDFYEPGENSGARYPAAITLSKLSGTDIVVTFDEPFFVGNPSFYIGGWIRSGARGETGIGKIVSVATDGRSCVVDNVTAPTFSVTQSSFPAVSAFTALSPLSPRIPGPSPQDAPNYIKAPDTVYAMIYHMKTVIAINEGTAGAAAARALAKADAAFPAVILPKFNIIPYDTSINGSVAVSNINDVSFASGRAPIVGSVNVSNFGDFSTSTGAAPIQGSVARTNANDTAIASGHTTVVGTSASTNANDTAVIGVGEMVGKRRRGGIVYDESPAQKPRVPRKDLLKSLDNAVDSFAKDKADEEEARLAKIKSDKAALIAKEEKAAETERLLNEARATIKYLDASLRTNEASLEVASRLVGDTRINAERQVSKLRAEIQELEDLMMIIAAL